MLKLYSHKMSNIVFNLLQPLEVRVDTNRESHSDMQASSTQANKQQANDKHTAEEGQIKRQGGSGGEENERQINVMRRIRVCDRYLVYNFCVSLPGNATRNSSCYFSSLRCIPSKRKGRCSTVA